MAETNTTAHLLARARKALVAGASAGIAAVIALVIPHEGAGMLADGKIDTTEAGTLIGAFFTAAVPAGYLAWQVPNADAKLASPDVATAAAVQTVQNLTTTDGTLPTITAEDVAAVGANPPADEPTGGKHAAV